jgi:hypothetical protein
MVFPHSRESTDIGWPIAPDRLKAEALRLLAAAGGEDALRGCAAQMAAPTMAQIDAGKIAG